ncbi:MAG: hypothetical protein QMC81_08260 [Thermoanaerobacterales bacterium]|nr:hypothetical protein [Thermoanaerobacterales bacterium]
MCLGRCGYYYVMFIGVAIMVLLAAVTGAWAAPGEVELVELGSWSGESVNIRAVQVADGYAYLADQSWGLRIVDLTDPSGPSPKALFSSIGARDVFAVEQQVYLAGTDGVKVINVSDPANPKQVGRFTISGGSTRVFGGNGWAYAVGGSTVYAVYNDDLKTVFTSSRSIVDAFVAGDRAYLTTSGGDGYFLTLADAADPLAWRALRSGSLTAAGQGVFARGSLIFIATGNYGLRIRTELDLSRDLGAFDTPGFAWDVRADERYAYVADGIEGVAVLDIADPATPVEVARYDTLNAQGLYVNGRCIYVAGGPGGLRTLLLNHPPDAPEAVSPRDGDTVDSLTPVLRAAFSDPDGDEPVSVTWQVYGDGLSVEFDGFTCDNGTVEADVPGDVRLEHGKTYSWRVGCTVPYEEEVLWSDWASFVTPEAPPPPPPAGDDLPNEGDPGEEPDPPAQDDPPGGDDPGEEPPPPAVEPDEPDDDPEPLRRYSGRRHRAEPRKVAPPLPLKLCQRGMITVSLNPCRVSSPYPVRPPLPVPPSDPGSGALDLHLPGGLVVGFAAPVNPNMVVRP